MVPSFERTSNLVARGLGITPAELAANWRVAEAGDVDAIVELRSTILVKQGRWNDAEYLQWRYGLGASRPAYARYRILLHDGKVIAGIGAEEFTLRSPVGDVAAACPMDILSLPQYRHFGLGPWLNQALFQEYPLVIALGANSNSTGLVRRLYSLLPGRQEFHFPLNVGTFLKKRLRPGILHPVVAPFVNAAVRTRAAWCTRLVRSHRSRITVMDRFDAKSDDALATCARDEICIARTADYLNWRYCDNPRARYRILALHCEGAIAGYLVYRRSDSGNGTQYMHIADWGIARTAAQGSFNALIGALLEDANSFRPAFIAASALGKMHQEQLLRAGFIRRAGEHAATGYRCAPHLAETFKPTQLWGLTDLGDDMDGVIMA